MSADSAVTYTSVHSEARSWSIPYEDPYEEAVRQLLEQAPRSPEYVPDPIELEDHVPVYIPEPEHPEDLVPAEDEAPIGHTLLRVAMAQMRATAPSTYHLLLPSGTLPLLPIPLPTPSTSRKADIPEADTPPRKRLLLTAPRPGCEVGESSAAAARQPGPTMARRVDYSSVDVCSRESSEFYSRHHDAQKDRAAVRAEIKIGIKSQAVMSADSAITYTSVHFEARSWSIPSEDPYEEAARQLLEQAPRSPKDKGLKEVLLTILLDGLDEEDEGGGGAPSLATLCRRLKTSRRKKQFVDDANRSDFLKYSEDLRGLPDRQVEFSKYYLLPGVTPVAGALIDWRSEMNERPVVDPATDQRQMQGKVGNSATGIYASMAGVGYLVMAICGL
ncbi:hypothetical protein Tco_0752770 [Tanacetum coccineum]|uniref:Uncharacterized protein n=1 Tax=Tanacetum coccineum TaxID=301880 RepID=A0ABQ4Z7T3_9ASTR